MGLIPESQKQHTDAIDLIIEACHKTQEVKQADGTIKKELFLDVESAWWKTHIINHNAFGRFAYELKRFENQAVQAFNFMCAPRAQVLAEQIIAIGEDWRHSIDAKSSEARFDDQNAQQTLLDRIIKNKQERTLTLKGDVKRSLFDGIRGREVEKEEDRD